MTVPPGLHVDYTPWCLPYEFWWVCRKFRKCKSPDISEYIRLKKQIKLIKLIIKIFKVEMVHDRIYLTYIYISLRRTQPINISTHARNLQWLHGKQKLFLPMWGLYTAVIPPIYFASSSDQHRPLIHQWFDAKGYPAPGILVGAMALLLDG